MNPGEPSPTGRTAGPRRRAVSIRPEVMNPGELLRGPLHPLAERVSIRPEVMNPGEPFRQPRPWGGWGRSFNPPRGDEPRGTLTLARSVSPYRFQSAPR